MIRSILNSIKLKKFYSKIINENHLCFDIGANIGKKSKLFLSTGAKVIAFEPQQECVKNLSILKTKYKKFSFHVVAIDSCEGNKLLNTSNYSEIATFSDDFKNIYKNKNVIWLDQKMVPTVSLNRIIELYGLPYFCKIDVEGYEFEILSSLNFNIPLIEFEVVAGFKKKAIDTINFLDNKNTSYNYTLNEQPYFQFKNWTNLKDIINVIKQLPDNQFHINIFVKNSH